MFSKTVIIFTAFMAAGVFAAPQAGVASANDNTFNVGEAALSCGNNQVISCCNQQKQESSGGLLGGLLGGIVGDLLGGSCSPLSVGGIVGGQVPLNKACGNTIAACCQGDQNGLINVQCSPISLL